MPSFSTLKLIAAVFLSTAALCQESAQSPPPIVVAPDEVTKVPSPKINTIDCSLFGASPGCPSYNELVTQGDKDILDQVNLSGFVCFRPDEDVFSIISFTPAANISYHIKNPYVSEAGGMVGYNRYKNGVNDDFQMATGTWKKLKGSDISDAAFHTTPGSDIISSIDSSEILFQYNYKNVANSRTTYILQIRRSTKRFIETFQFPYQEDSADAKPKGLPRKPADTKQVQETGHCAQLN